MPMSYVINENYDETNALNANQFAIPEMPEITLAKDIGSSLPEISSGINKKEEDEEEKITRKPVAWSFKDNPPQNIFDRMDGKYPEVKLPAFIGAEKKDIYSLVTDIRAGNITDEDLKKQLEPISLKQNWENKNLAPIVNEKNEIHLNSKKEQPETDKNKSILASTKQVLEDVSDHFKQGLEDTFDYLKENHPKLVKLFSTIAENWQKDRTIREKWDLNNFSSLQSKAFSARGYDVAAKLLDNFNKGDGSPVYLTREELGNEKLLTELEDENVDRFKNNTFVGTGSKESQKVLEEIKQAKDGTTIRIEDSWDIGRKNTLFDKGNIDLNLALGSFNTHSVFEGTVTKEGGKLYYKGTISHNIKDKYDFDTGDTIAYIQKTMQDKGYNKPFMVNVEPKIEEIEAWVTIGKDGQLQEPTITSRKTRK